MVMAVLWMGVNFCFDFYLRETKCAVVDPWIKF